MIYAFFFFLVRFENGDHIVQVYGNTTLAEAVQALCRNRVGVIAVVDKGTKKIIGAMRKNDIHLLLQHKDLFYNKE